MAFASCLEDPLYMTILVEKCARRGLELAKAMELATRDPAVSCILKSAPEYPYYLVLSDTFEMAHPEQVKSFSISARLEKKRQARVRDDRQ